MFLGCLVGLIGSLVLLVIYFRLGNDRQEFIWATSSIDMLLFLIGSMYYLCGSYHPTIAVRHIQDEIRSTRRGSHERLTEIGSSVHVLEHTTVNGIEDDKAKHIPIASFKVIDPLDTSSRIRGV